MWQRRTPEDIALIDRARKIRESRFNPVIPLCFAFFLALFSTLVCWAGWRGKWAPWGDPIPILDAAIRFPFFLVIGFLVIYLSRVLGLWDKQVPMVICSQCQKVDSGQPGQACSCGGELERLEHWRWIEKQKPSWGLRIVRDK